MDDSLLDFNSPKESSKIIKVIGVGGGGGNAVTHMYRTQRIDVSFVLCNTDSQALNRSDVPDKIILGRKITEGLGAGNKPDVAKLAAEESVDELKSMLGDGTRMVFITAGMGGGTGTGAAPVVAKIAKEMGILTVAIVTIPFEFEGMPKIMQALNGVEAISQNVDALLVINNERLRVMYKDLTLRNAFAKADDTLSVAAKSIADIITMDGIINLDFADVRTTMKDGGVALMSNGYGKGENRVQDAIQDAVNSPLLNNNDVYAAKKILFNISYSEKYELTMEETKFVTEFMEGMSRFRSGLGVIWGHALDNELEEQVKITLLATGFDMDDIPEIAQKRELEGSNITNKEMDLYKRFYSGFLPKVKVTVLSSEELEDDSLIVLMENEPTYKREQSLINNQRIKGVDADKKENTQDEEISVEKPKDEIEVSPEEPKESNENNTIFF